MRNYSLTKILSFFFVITVFITTRQFPLSFLSPVMNVTVLIMLIITIFGLKNKVDVFLVLGLLLLPLTISLVYSVALTDNGINEIIRFYIILISVGLAYFIKVNKLALRWFVWLAVFQSLILICIFLYVIIFLGQSGYIPLRLWFLDQGWGDIYTYNGIFYRIQIKGSALLLIALILTLESDVVRRKYIIASVLSIGVILAGNFAFLLSGAIYLVVTIFRLKNVVNLNSYLLRVFFSLFILLCLSSTIYKYVDQTMKLKQEGSTSVRTDQVIQLTKNLAENPFTLLLGQGLGNTLTSKSDYRDYSGKTYYELQIYYVFNQLGVIFFSLYILFHILIVATRWGKHEVVIYYLVYVSYAITNPYILDTTHFIIIVVLNSWCIYGKEKSPKTSGSSDYYTLSS